MTRASTQLERNTTAVQDLGEAIALLSIQCHAVSREAHGAALEQVRRLLEEKAILIGWLIKARAALKARK